MVNINGYINGNGCYTTKDRLQTRTGGLVKQMMEGFC